MISVEHLMEIQERLDEGENPDDVFNDVYELGRAEAIDEVLSHTKTIVDEDGIIFEAVLVKNINKLLSQSEIDKSIHGKELNMPRLSDNEIDDLLSTLNPNEVTTDCDDCKARIRAEAIEEFNTKVNYLKNCYVDACNICTKMECDICAVSNFIDNLEQLEKQKGE